MSYTELHTGKLKIVRKEMSIEELKNFYEVNKDILNIEIEDFEEMLEDGYEFFEIRDKSKKYKEDLYIKYIYNKGTLYEMVEHTGGESSDWLDKTTFNEDGTVNFTYLFYNGGTCFSEMLEDGLDSIKED